ncbi:MAG: helix-turn-helix transcriptional regulator [Francisellaceae bacterium]|jgi:HTH-type transcriptional regulator / antitoxin HipB|nr:helix-turn-helix transcriptional regulator [Francisellaceae bacterium]MBT6206891.1 helix-turn-helix transcriptional regulator [Francisellaceae bacterium]MBT6538038.1 helix-turn-helix transcriptional regulator [Francisellaceae bacterium]
MNKVIRSPKELGQAAREARKAQDLSQEELAGISGTGRRFISDLENGKQSSQIGKVLHVISTLGLSLEINRKWGK